MKKTKAKIEDTELIARRELIEAINQISKDKGISKDVLFDTLKNAMLAACKNEFVKSDNNNQNNGGYNNREANNNNNNNSNKLENVKININTETGAIDVLAEKTIVEEVNDKISEITLEEAQKLFPDKKYELGEVVQVVVTPKNFMRISAQKAKQSVLQKIREEERKVIYSHFVTREHEIVSGYVQHMIGKSCTISLGRTDAILPESEQIPGERFKENERIRVYVVEVKDTNRGPKITVSRSNKEFVRRLFEEQVTEVKDGIVEIKSIAREAGYRTKIAVYSNDPDVDPLGACVGLNGERVNNVVDELSGEKIDIVNWDIDPAKFIENALSPAKVISVDVDVENKFARVIVPDDQLSLAIGREGQNSRLAAKLTGFKIDIKPEYGQEEFYEEDGNNLEDDSYYVDNDNDTENDSENDDEYYFDEGDE